MCPFVFNHSLRQLLVVLLSYVVSLLEQFLEAVDRLAHTFDQVLQVTDFVLLEPHALFELFVVHGKLRELQLAVSDLRHCALAQVHLLLVLLFQLLDFGS